MQYQTNEDLFNSAGFVCTETAYTDELLNYNYQKTKPVIAFFYLEDELVLIYSGSRSDIVDMIGGRIQNTGMEALKAEGKLNLIKYYIIRDFLSEDQCSFYTSFCVDKFKPRFNIYRVTPEDRVDVFQTRFSKDVAEEGADTIKQELYNSIRVLECHGVPKKIIQSVLVVSEALYDTLVNSGTMVAPFEYVSIDDGIRVDTALLKHHSSVFYKDLIEKANSLDSVMNW